MEHTVAGQRFTLYDAVRLEMVVDWMAAQAFPLLAGAEDPLLLGILRRGGPLSVMLQARLRANYGLDIARYEIKLKRYADDLALLHPDTELTEDALFAARDISRATVMVVDDVLFEGHSLARVLAYLTGRGAAAVHAAVLVDRCVATLPVKADVVGLCLQLSDRDVVECHVPPYEAAFKIELLRPDRLGEH
ncbi:bifunctional pyr operon transcriptional regulator/uracil phosphoribosyltransferase PyrR [Niveibacterium umoris]|uniref:Pyrimidine operon attenuation protein/uracil phosphoribosyltransferase n=1 Tax=Niveibacterium umoris TaxID=1193620 RepID=A0A840BWV2_9RHOO|nr:phosphoribosyltransferase family protein [Niveibacterium umoris]MBB4014787.1 pyrimidine operon attenuation protein/uracil phosphoribosyltransferase [Niveibacterium umoris]